MTYSEKLKDPRWQRKRLEILERDNWTCRFCDATTKTLHVHHFKYKEDPWDASNSYLITLCEDCHEEDHDSRKQSEEMLIDALKFSGLSSGCINNIAWGIAHIEMVAHPRIVTAAIESALQDPFLLAQLIERHEEKEKIREEQRKNLEPNDDLPF